MTVASKNIYFNVLNDIVNKYSITYHRNTKMKPIDVKSNSYAEYNVDSTKEDSQFQLDDHVRISIFAKEYTSNWPEEVFVISKIKNTVRWPYVIIDLNGEEFVRTFYEKELQETNQEEFRIRKSN